MTRRLNPSSHARREHLRPADAIEIHDDVERLLSVLGSASLIVGPDHAVVRTNERAAALGLISRGRIAIPEIATIVAEVVEQGVPRESEMRVRRPPLGRELMDLRVRVAPLDAGAVVVLVNDLGEERRADVVRRDFVANVSHELKTPVGALSLLAEAVFDSADDPEQVRRFGQRMRVEAERLAHLVQDLIDLSRLQADDPLTHAQIVSIDELIHRAVDEVRTVAQGAGVEFILGDDCGVSVFGDQGQLTTALRNLLSNAIAYSPPATKVAVDARTLGAIVEIAVKDQGIGIPANELDRVFERFYRIDQARSRATGGTGLGLSIVKHVCQNHGGECRVWSEVGVGSTFMLRLPVYGGDGPIYPSPPVSLVEEASS